MSYLISYTFQLKKEDFEENDVNQALIVIIIWYCESLVEKKEKPVTPI